MEESFRLAGSACCPENWGGGFCRAAKIFKSTIKSVGRLNDWRFKNSLVKVGTAVPYPLSQADSEILPLTIGAIELVTRYYGTSRPISFHTFPDCHRSPPVHIVERESNELGGEFMTSTTHFFLGANSGQGFQTLFPRFCRPEDFHDLLVLKGGPGVGKSTLLGMIAREVEADINVIALVGERGREVLEFIERDLGEKGMARSVLVVATSDQPSMMRNKCPMTATAIAEYFKDQGKNVLLMMDSLTRYAMAQREIGLATGEAPIARGYTPSIYTAMPKLLERAGNFENGSITGIYTVLVEGDDTNEPISDTVRGIIDGHIILSRKVAARNHYPAIEILESVSRLMTEITDKEQRDVASKMRNLLSVYYANFDLVSIGAYKKGTNPALDEALRKIDKINAFLQQATDEAFSYEETVQMMKNAVK